MCFGENFYRQEQISHELSAMHCQQASLALLAAMVLDLPVRVLKLLVTRNYYCSFLLTEIGSLRHDSKAVLTFDHIPFM